MTQTDMKVLIVDDDEDMRDMVGDFISKMGVKIRTAGTVPDAQRLIITEVPPFDLVLADLKLPGGSGLDILRAAHDRSPASLVTIITGYASLETAIEAIRLGAYDYITKPFSLDEIGVQLRNMMERMSLSKENARLSIRLQELYAQVNLLQAEREEISRLREDIRKELGESNRKLDRLLANQGCPGPDLPAAAPHGDKDSIAELFHEIEKLDRQKRSGTSSPLELEGEKKNLIENLVAEL